jgi:phosphatidylglycerol:prolipoprotein diacylglycerol transferase
LHPILLNTTIAGHHLYLSSYTLFNLILNPLAVMVVGYVLMRRQGFKARVTLLSLLSLCIAVIAFSRLSNYVLNRNYYLENGISIFQLSSFGFTMFGGFILAIPLIFLWARLVKFPPGRLFDLLTPGWALGIFFNKIGCLLNGCCFGRPTALPWGLVYPAGSLPYRYFRTVSQQGGDLTVITPLFKLVPVQIYESIIGLLGFLLALTLLKRKLPPGVVCLGFAFLYSAARLGMHYVRVIDPHTQYAEFLPLVYVGCILLAGGLLALILLRSENHAHR